LRGKSFYKRDCHGGLLGKRIVLALGVFLCSFSAFSFENQSLDFKNQTQLKRAYEESHGVGGASELGSSAAVAEASWLNGFKKAFQKFGFLGKSARNVTPTAGDIFAYTNSSGPRALYVFNTTDAMADSDGQVISVTWSFSDGTSMAIPAAELDSHAQISHVFPGVGTYTATLKIYDDAGEFTTLTKDITVTNNGAPTPAFSATALTGNAIHFNGNARDPELSVAKYIFNFGDGSAAFESTTSHVVDHTYSAPGSYDVTFEAWDTAGAVNSITKTIYVAQAIPTDAQPNPMVKLSAVFGEAPFNVTFTGSYSVNAANTVVTTYEWDFGDNDSVATKSKLSNPTHKYKKPGTYFGRLRVWDADGNWADRYFSIYVGVGSPQAPNIVAEQNNNSRQIDFMGDAWAMPVTADRNAFFWNFGDSKTYNGNYPQHTYALNGTYTVRLVVHDIQGVRHVLKKEITVTDQQDAPQANFNVDSDYQNISQTGNYFAENSSDPQQNQPMLYTWVFGDGATQVGTDLRNVSHSFSERGHYPVRLFVTNSRGISYDGLQDVMVQDGSETRSKIYYNPRIGVAPLTVSFQSAQSYVSNSTIVRRSWLFNDGDFSTSSSVSKTFTQPGNYGVKLYIIDALGNESVAQRDVIVLDSNQIPSNNQLPVANFRIEYNGSSAGDLAFRADQSSDQDGEIKFYEWRVDNVNLVDGRDLFQNLSPGTHTVRLAVRDNWNGIDTLTKVFKVGFSKTAVLDVTYTPSAPVLLEDIQFSAVNTIVTGIEAKTYRWDFGDGNTAAGETTHHVYAAAGTYVLKMYVTDLDGQRQTLTTNVVVGAP
jgi:PKD repeat protein